MSEMSLDEQIRCMQGMKEYLGDFCREMQNTMEDFQSEIKYLRSVGLSTETEESYQHRYFAPANNDVEQVVSDVYGPHYNYIDDVIDDLTRARNE